MANRSKSFDNNSNGRNAAWDPDLELMSLDVVERILLLVLDCFLQPENPAEEYDFGGSRDGNSCRLREYIKSHALGP